MTTTRIPASKCPACGKVFDSADTLTGDYVPRPKDITICIRCGACLEFDAELHVHPIAVELLDPENRREVEDIRLAIRKIRHINN